MTLKLVARWGDACNVGGGDPNVIRQKLAMLREHCEAVGRDYNAITKSTNVKCSTRRGRGQGARDRPGRQRVRLLREALHGRHAASITAPAGAAVEAGADYIIAYMPRVAYDTSLLQPVAYAIRQFA